MAGPPDHSDHNCNEALSDRTIHDLRAPLTVIKAQAQMVRRWLQREDVVGAEVAVKGLAAIDAMVERMSDQLHDLDGTPPQDERGTSRKGQSGR